MIVHLLLLTFTNFQRLVKVDESKFESAGDDSVIKVDLNKPPTPKEEKNEW